jgi:hypothetical protein
VLATLLIAATFALLVAGYPLVRRLQRHPTPERCVVMLERYADQDARAHGRVPSPTPTAHLPLDAPEVARCTRDITDEEISCALAAGYVDALERCLPSR